MRLTIDLVAGFPQPQYRWLKDGDYISGFSSEHFYKVNILTIYNFYIGTHKHFNHYTAIITIIQPL